MPVTVFEHVNLFDGLELLIDQTVVVDGPTITAVGRGMELPSGATRVVGAGKTLLPGLIAEAGAYADLPNFIENEEPP